MGSAKLFLDTNIVLDLFDKRPFELDNTISIYKTADAQKIQLYISESVITNAIYLSQTKDLSLALRSLLQLATVLPSSNTIIHSALESPFKHKEDAILYHLAVAHKMDAFITRNTKDFVPFALAETVVVVTPAEAIIGSL